MKRKRSVWFPEDHEGGRTLPHGDFSRQQTSQTGPAASRRPRDQQDFDLDGLGADLGDVGIKLRRQPSKLANALFCGALVGVAIAAGQWASASPLLLTSLISSAVLVTTAPRSPQCRPGRILASNMISLCAGMAMHSAMPASAVAIGLSVALALAFILFFDALHPPAVANAGLAFSLTAGPVELLILTAVTSSILAAIATLLAGVTMRPPMEPLRPPGQTGTATTRGEADWRT